jgi:DNA (cytosine-5)-methyltransferase 1
VAFAQVELVRTRSYPRAGSTSTKNRGKFSRRRSEEHVVHSYRMSAPRQPTSNISAVDLFCGAGGLTYGLQQAGIRVIAGIDLDPACEFPFTKNNESTFIKADVGKLAAEDVARLYPAGSIRLLAGCAPCQPFSPFRRGTNTSRKREWSLLREFARLVRDVIPELVTMENVPDLASKSIFLEFVRSLKRLGYTVDFDSVYCPRVGVPQRRRRLVLVASMIGLVRVPRGNLEPTEFRTVRDTIAKLPVLAAGETDAKDPLHKARLVSELNLRRLRASVAGGTWRDWPEDLRAPCHRKKSGSSFQAVYSRMVWDEPAPTITTLSYNFGTGRFGHPEQDRAITLREAALLQTFPRNYHFSKPRERVHFLGVGRLIGNAVPPRLGEAIGRELARVVRAHRT